MVRKLPKKGSVNLVALEPQKGDSEALPPCGGSQQLDFFPCWLMVNLRM